MNYKIKPTVAIFTNLAGYLCFFLALFPSILKAQDTQTDNSPKILLPSANAASLGQYGQVPVSLFNGLAQTSIPFYSIKVDNAVLPIELSYHASGIKPDNHPGWVGLGWNLAVAGTITRIANNANDEFYTENDLNSYYYHYSDINKSNWYVGKENLINYTGFNYPAQPNPDEFVFNFGPFSGSFFWDHTGNWKVKSSQPNFFKVEASLKDNFILKGQTNCPDAVLRKIFHEFIITTDDGTKYFFGGTPESIEFTRGQYENGGNYNENIIANSWQLTKVITPTGKQVILKYERDGINISFANSFAYSAYIAGTAERKVTVDLRNVSVNFVNPSYLSEIETPTEKIKFFRSKSTELKFNHPTGLANTDKTHYSDIAGYGGYETKNFDRWFKLDSISINSAFNNRLLKKIKFTYTNDVTKRLMLTSLRESNKNNYTFVYDQTPLPPYNSRKIDHWGFYHGGIDYFDNTKPASDYSKNDVPAYTLSREPNPAFMQAGILKEIKYPTGGYTKFEYEANTYSSVATKYPFGLDTFVVNKYAGGLRIKKITHQDSNRDSLIVKTYSYVKNYKNGGSLSSGILAGYPQYLDEGAFFTGSLWINYWFWQDHFIGPLNNTNGNHITYTEVTESSSDGSFVVNKFSNHDQARYRDQLCAGAIYSTRDLLKTEPFTSMALERGQLLGQYSYDKSKKLVKQVVNEYNNDPTRYNNHVRAIQRGARTFGDMVDFRATAFMIYTYQTYLTKQTTTEFNNDINTVQSVRSNVYDPVYNKMVEDRTINSDGVESILRYNYPFSYQIQALIEKNMVGTPVQTITYKKLGGVEKVMNAELTTYKKFSFNKPDGSFFLAPYKKYQLETSTPLTDFRAFQISSSTAPEDFIYDTRMIERFTYNYNASANLTTLKPTLAPAKGYKWGYKNLFPIAVCENGLDSEFYYEGFEEDITAPTATIKAHCGEKLNYNRTFKVPFVKPNTRTYKISWFQWNGSQWVYNVEDYTGDKTFAATVSVDDISVYPADAKLNTYNYEPAIGITSTINEKGETFYYEYDENQRLKLIRDADRNITSSFCYSVTGEPTNCNATIYYNTEQSQVFTKDCAVGFTGSNVTYTVPAGKYSSTISQADANRMATEEILQNGKTNANNIGTCDQQMILVSASNTNQYLVVKFTFTDQQGQIVYSKVLIGGASDAFYLPYGLYNVAFSRENTQGSFSVKYGGIDIGVGGGISNDRLTLMNVLPKNIVIY